MQTDHQETSQLVPGATLRIAAPSVIGHRFQATLVRLSADSLIVQPEYDNPMVIPLSSVTKLEMRGKKPNTLKGAGMGFLIGAGVGAMLLAIIDCEDILGPTLPGGRCTTDVLEGMVTMTAAGALVGAVIGSFSHTDRWVKVPLDRLTIGLAPQRTGGLALSASVAF